MDYKLIKTIWDSEDELRCERNIRLDYYDGKHSILNEVSNRIDGEEDNRIPCNLIDIGVDQHSSFLLGNPVNYKSIDDSKENEGLKYLDWLYKKYSLDTADINNFQNAISCDYSVEFIGFDKKIKGYDDKEGEVYFKNYIPTTWKLVIDDEKLVLAIYKLELPIGTYYDGSFLENKLDLFVVYDDKNKYTYSKVKNTYKLIDTEPYIYGFLPVNWYQVGSNLDHHFIGDDTISLQDAYNKVQSLSLDDLQFNVKALLRVSKDCNLFERETIQEKIVNETTGQIIQDELYGNMPINNIRKYRVIPDENAEYIERGNEKDLYEFVEDTLRKKLHKALRIVDIDEISNSTGTVSGISLKLKFAIMLNQAFFFEKYFSKGLKRRIEMINKINEAIGRRSLIIDNFEIVFNKALPTDKADILKILPLKEIMSDKDMLGMIPDVNPEIAVLNKENQDKERMKQAQTPNNGVDNISVQ